MREVEVGALKELSFPAIQKDSASTPKKKKNWSGASLYLWNYKIKQSLLHITLRKEIFKVTWD